MILADIKHTIAGVYYLNVCLCVPLSVMYVVRDDIKSLGKFAILSPFKIA